MKSILPSIRRVSLVTTRPNGGLNLLKKEETPSNSPLARALNCFEEVLDQLIHEGAFSDSTRADDSSDFNGV